MNSSIGSTEASDTTLPRIILIPVGASLTKDQLVYDGSIPVVNYIVDSQDPETVFNTLLSRGVVLVRTKLAIIDPSMLATFDALIPDDFSDFIGNIDADLPCDGPVMVDEGVITDLGEALIRSIAHTVARDLLLDLTSGLGADTVFGGAAAGFDSCEYILIGALFNGYADDIVDRSIIEVMTVAPATTAPAVVLPDTGSDALNLLAAAGIAVAAGGVLTLARRRRPA